MNELIELLNNPWGAMVLLSLGVLGLVALIVGLRRLYLVLLMVNGYPNEEQIEKYLIPLLRKVIIAVYEVSEHSLDKLGRQLEAIDKRKLARMMYDYLPDAISVGPLKWQWKKAVSEQRFSDLVEHEFQRLIELYRSAESGILKELEPDFPVGIQTARP